MDASSKNSARCAKKASRVSSSASNVTAGPVCVQEQSRKTTNVLPRSLHIRQYYRRLARRATSQSNSSPMADAVFYTVFYMTKAGSPLSEYPEAPSQDLSPFGSKSFEVFASRSTPFEAFLKPFETKGLFKHFPDPFRTLPRSFRSLSQAVQSLSESFHSLSSA